MFQHRSHYQLNNKWQKAGVTVLSVTPKGGEIELLEYSSRVPMATDYNVIYRMESKFSDLFPFSSNILEAQRKDHDTYFSH